MKPHAPQKHYILLEPAVCPGRLPGRFFRFCLWRNKKLLRFVPMQLFSALLSLFSFFRPAKKLAAETAWRFLPAVSNLPKATAAFATRKRPFVMPAGADVLVTDGPFVLFSLWFGRHVQVLANPFDLKAGKFLSYQTEAELLAALPAPISTLTAGFFPSFRALPAKRRLYAAASRTFASPGKALAGILANSAAKGLLLAFLGVAVGVLSLVFAKEGSFGADMFYSYFQTGQIAVLNLIPPVFLMFFFYALFNRAVLAFSGTFLITMVATWISYFKRLYRDDPLFFEEITLVREANAMSNAYAIQLTPAIWLSFAAALAVCAALFFLPKRPKKPSASVLLLAAVCCIGGLLFANVYQNEEIYLANRNEAQINSFSPAEQFVSRGFVYPFLYSAKDVLGSSAPQNYDKTASAALESTYTTADIPETQKVDVLFLMLESFNDFSRFPQIPFQKNPYALFESLAAESVSGRLVVNTFGGGTIDTERRVLSGYTRLPSFQQETNSFARYFASQGYQTFGAHPNYGWFYSRDDINRNLGFADFDFYAGTEQNAAEIRTDAAFFPHVLQLYREKQAESAPSFGFFVTYQGHGPYDGEKTYENPFLAQGALSDETYRPMEDYFQQAADTAKHLLAFADAVAAQSRPCVLVIFGDHNPYLGKNGFESLGISLNTAGTEGFANYYSTPYLIWGNDAAKQALDFSFSGEGPTISPEFLIPTLFDLFGWQGDTQIAAASVLSKRIPVVHKTGRFLENTAEGFRLTEVLLPENEALLRQFLSFQYDKQTTTP